MKVGVYDTTLIAGAEWTRTLNFKDSDNAAFSLTDFVHVQMDLRSSASSAAVVRLTSKGATPNITFTASTGEIVLALTGADTLAIPGGTYVYDVALLTAADVALVILRGSIQVTPMITQVS